jgi:hypothetical protein
MPLTEKLNLGPDPTKTLVYLLLPLLFLLIVFPAVYQSDQVFIAEYHDTVAQLIPDLLLMQNPFALWNNQWITGYSEIANVNSDRFYPFSTPLLLLSQNIFFVNIILLLNLYIAYLAFFKLGSILVRNPDLLMLFSMAYMFSGVLISRVSIGHIYFVYAMAWIPLLYYFFLKIAFKSETTAFNIAALALCETLVFLASGSYFFIFANVIIFIFFLWYAIAGNVTRSTILALGASAVTFVLLSAIKLIPDITGLQYIVRIDPINPLGDGGSLENNFASFIFGTPIDTVFGSYESMALVGIIVVLLAIIALLYGNRDIAIPSFFAIAFSLLWADGGRTVFSFIHLLPLVNNFRNAGRIFGALMPLLLLLALYGMVLLYQKTKNRESFALSGDQKRNILIGVAILALVKILELPYFAVPSLEAILALVLVFGFLLLFYLDKANETTILGYFAIALLVNIALIIRNFTVFGPDTLIRGSAVAVILVAVVLLLNRQSLGNVRLKQNFFVGLLVIGLVFSIIGNISVLQVYDPHFNESPAKAIIEKIKEQPSATPQVWVYDVGWPIKHMDFTYWYIKSGIHPVRAYYSQFPVNTPPLSMKIGNQSWYIADYIVDTAYLENGNQNLDAVSYKVNNLSVFRPEHVLPNAFVVRGEQLVPATFDKFTSDEVVLSGQFLPGDIAVLKTAFYPGWKVNGADAGNAGNMVAASVPAATSTITFRYDPGDVKAGLFLTVLGLLLLVALVVKRSDIDRWLRAERTPITEDKPRKRKRS